MIPSVPSTSALFRRIPTLPMHAAASDASLCLCRLCRLCHLCCLCRLCHLCRLCCFASTASISTAATFTAFAALTSTSDVPPLPPPPPMHTSASDRKLHWVNSFRMWIYYPTVPFSQSVTDSLMETDQEGDGGGRRGNVTTRVSCCLTWLSRSRD
jgi:hypothetical protein